MKRIIIKLSGEALGGDGRVFDFNQAETAARVLVQALKTGNQIGVVIGAGNIWRGRQGQDMNAVTADQMGMLGTVINCLYMTDAVRRAGAKSRVMSAIEMPRVAEIFHAGRAIEYMEAGEIVFFAGGSGNPFFTTDTAVVLRAVETQADIILLAKKVDAVYDSDPEENPDAKKYERLTHQEVLEKNLKVMDSTAASICRDNGIKIHVFGIADPDNMNKAVCGEPIGTFIS